MGNYCSELCNEPEIQVLRISDFQTSPKPTKRDSLVEHEQQLFVPSAQKGYFTESFEPIVNTFDNLLRETRPPYKFSTGGVYEGEWVGNQRDGYGVMVWAERVGRASFGMLMEILMKESGLKIKHMVMAFMFILMEHDMKAIGKMTYRMVMELKFGQMVADMKAFIQKERNMAKEDIVGLMEVYMLDLGKRIASMEKESMNGQMEENMMGNGKIIICTEKEFIVGMMAESMKDNMYKIRNMAMGHIHGKMVENMKVNGKMANNMGKEYIVNLMDNREQDFGKMAKELNGLMNELLLFLHSLFNSSSWIKIIFNELQCYQSHSQRRRFHSRNLNSQSSNKKTIFLTTTFKISQKQFKSINWFKRIRLLCQLKNKLKNDSELLIISN